MQGRDGGDGGTSGVRIKPVLEKCQEETVWHSRSSVSQTHRAWCPEQGQQHEHGKQCQIML